MSIHLTINKGWPNIAVSSKDVDPNIESNGKILSLKIHFLLSNLYLNHQRFFIY